jgi:hypothetical protein
MIIGMLDKAQKLVLIYLSLRMLIRLSLKLEE